MILGFLYSFIIILDLWIAYFLFMQKFRALHNNSLWYNIGKTYQIGAITMQTKQLRFFLTLADCGSITKAGRLLYTTQQNVSKVIRQLEDELGTTLFLRSQKGVELTETGRLFLSSAQKIMNEYSAVVSAIANFERERNLHGDLCIYSTVLISNIILPTLIDHFSALYPAVNFRLEETGHAEVLQQVALHNNQLGITQILKNPTFRDIYAPYINNTQLYSITQDAFECAVGRSSPLADHKIVSLHEFTQYPIVMLRSHAFENNILLEVLRRAGQSRVALTTSSPHMYTQSIISGKYVGISSRTAHIKSSSFIERESLLIPFEEDLSFDVALAINDQPALDKVADAFVRFVKTSRLFD